ncbi:MAG TPA: ABC transporter permease [Thermoanaerobaculia bacterium]|nr:ABC transporter permease [Thermoanaerobaculia bacterium]
MRLDNIVVVAKREYLQRVRTKGFWISTLLIPVFISAITVLPTLLIFASQTSQTIVVVDETGRLAQDFVKRATSRGEGKTAPGDAKERGLVADESKMARFEVTVEPFSGDPERQRAALNGRVLAEEIDAWVWIGPSVLTGGKAEYHARSVSNLFTQDALEDELSATVRRARLSQAGLDPDRVGELTRPVKLETIKISKEGSRAEGGPGGMLFGVLLFMMLYMMMFIWGQQVMNSVLEEKGSRVIEVLVSTLRPFDLLMGKLVGTCLAGLTQLALWQGTLVVLTAPRMIGAIGRMPEGVSIPTMTPLMAINFLLFFILGFFTFSTLYAAIGSAFNNLQEAQQTASVAVIFLILPVFVMYPVINDPNSTMAVVMSLIPLFTPLMMPLRMTAQMPPAWQILLAYALTLGFIVVMVWFCARIYRIGILMYGKKPTIQEIWRWTRYA